MMYIHLHVASWGISLILFFMTWITIKSNERLAEILHMINRIVFLAILFTGIMLIYRYTQAPVWSDFGVEAIVKGLAGVWLIVVMEMFYIRYKKGVAYRGLLVQFFFMLAIVLILGFGRLPWGFFP